MASIRKQSSEHYNYGGLGGYENYEREMTSRYRLDCIDRTVTCLPRCFQERELMTKGTPHVKFMKWLRRGDLEVTLGEVTKSVVRTQKATETSTYGKNSIEHMFEKCSARKVCFEEGRDIGSNEKYQSTDVCTKIPRRGILRAHCVEGKETAGRSQKSSARDRNEIVENETSTTPCVGSNAMESTYEDREGDRGRGVEKEVDEATLHSSSRDSELKPIVMEGVATSEFLLTGEVIKKFRDWSMEGQRYGYWRTLRPGKKTARIYEVRMHYFCRDYRQRKGFFITGEYRGCVANVLLQKIINKLGWLMRRRGVNTGQCKRSGLENTRERKFLHQLEHELKTYDGQTHDRPTGDLTGIVSNTKEGPQGSNEELRAGKTANTVIWWKVERRMEPKRTEWKVV